MRKKNAAVAVSKKAPAKKSAKKEKPEATETPAEQAPVETVVEETTRTEAKVTPVKKGRDNSVYIYQGAEYKKGRLVHKIISDHAASAGKGKLSFEQLRTAFPESIQKRFHVFKKENETQALNSAGRERFFSKPEELIKLKNATIAVTNQWTAQSLAPFLKVAASLGYKVKVK